MRYTIMHVSDLHAGPPFNHETAFQLIDEANALAPDLLVVSGDFVQRADFVVQWKMITSFLEKLPTPRLVVPGNHDVPLYNVFNRLFRPYARYRRYISPDLNPVFELPGLQVVGGCTAHGLTTDGGRLSGQQIATMEAAFSRAPAATCKIAVLHHHVVNPPGCEHRNKISNADEVVELLDRCGVEVLLCGHIHVSYIGSTLDVLPHLQRGTIICQSGTSTSRRGARREQGKNSYSVIVVEDRVIRIRQHLFLESARRFEPVAEHIFPRRSNGVYAVPAAELTSTEE